MATSSVALALLTGCASPTTVSKATYISPVAAEAAVRQTQVQWVGPQQPAVNAENAIPRRTRAISAPVERRVATNAAPVEPQWPTPAGHSAPRTGAPVANTPAPTVDLSEIRAELKRTNSLLATQAAELEQARAGQGRLIEQQDALLREIEQARAMAEDASRLATANAAAMKANESAAVATNAKVATSETTVTPAHVEASSEAHAALVESPSPVAPTIAPALADALRAWSSAKARYATLDKERSSIESAHADGVTPLTEEQTQTIADLQKQMRQAGRQAVVALGQVGKFDAEQRKLAARVLKDDSQLPAEQRTLIATLAE